MAGATSPLEALEQLRAAYIEFGALNPAFYRLMIGRDLAREQSSPELREPMANARVALRSILAAGARAGVFALDADDEEALLAAAVSAWSLVHGFALLSIDQVLSREAGATDSMLLARQVIRRTIRGFV